MKKALMKSKFYIGIALIVQAVSMIILFFTQLKKSKSLATAFLAVAAVSGAVGGYLVATGAKEEDEKNEMLEALREDFFEINEDDIAEEDEAVYCTCEGDDDFDIEIDGEDDGIEDEE